MRRIMPVLLLCVLTTACSVRIVKQESPTPIAAMDAQATDQARIATYVAATVAALKPLATVTPMVTLTPTMTPTLAPSPTKPATPAQPVRTPVPTPVIQSFTSSSYEISPGNPITLFWNSTGGVRATLRRTTASGAGSFEREVAPSGSLIVDSQGAGRHWHDYELIVYSSAGTTARSMLNVHFRCSSSFFFGTLGTTYLYDPRLCPDGPPQSTQAAEQVFEGGRMIWLEHAAPIRQWDWGSGGNDDFVILTLYEPGVAWPQKQTFVDAWLPSEPDSDPSIVPPAGKFQPARGFGKVWRTHSDVRQKLGWALTQEKAFEATFQFVSDFYGHSECLYLRLAEGRVMGTCRRDGSWGFLTP